MEPRRAVRSEPSLIRVAFDTNILVYAEELGFAPGDDVKFGQSQVLLRRVAESGVRPQLSVQALGELHHVLLRKARLNGDEAFRRVQALRGWFELTPTDDAIFGAALDLSAMHRIATFDAIIIAAAVSARCDLLVSEDLQDGFAWRGVTVVNPFGPTPDRRLAALPG